MVTGSLSPLPPENVALLETSAEAARNVVVEHAQQDGWPEGGPWADGDCVLTAWYERRPMSYAPNPPAPSAVYVVRLIGRDDPGRTAWVMVEAATGELASSFGGPVGDLCSETSN